MAYGRGHGTGEKAQQRPRQLPQFMQDALLATLEKLQQEAQAVQHAEGVAVAPQERGKA